MTTNAATLGTYVGWRTSDDHTIEYEILDVEESAENARAAAKELGADVVEWHGPNGETVRRTADGTLMPTGRVQFPIWLVWDPQPGEVEAGDVMAEIDNANELERFFCGAVALGSLAERGLAIWLDEAGATRDAEARGLPRSTP